ncbi:MULTISPECIES: hypothetical protein [unclassified Micromonospora]|uniref:hypothetical protein n=1 Tax=unclassified Micromonospora TaxID=2617518 RepID=UPI00332A35D4
MADPPKHPVEQPALRSLMLTSLVLAAALLVCGAQPGASSRFLNAITALFFAVFVVTFGLYWLAWVLREHELWREGRRGQEE